MQSFSAFPFTQVEFYWVTLLFIFVAAMVASVFTAEGESRRNQGFRMFFFCVFFACTFIHIFNNPWVGSKNLDLRANYFTPK